MEGGLLQVIRGLIVAGSVAVLAGAQSPPSPPGCIAALTKVPLGAAASGQVVTFTDGTIVSPMTRFVSRTWEFGDGTSATSTRAGDVSVTHSYENGTGRVESVTVRLAVKTALAPCSTALQFDVEPAS
jgi:PKD domain